jgi:Icc-related predicted phosphoesterase
MRVEALILAGDLLGVPEGFETVEAAQQTEADSIAAMLEAISVPVYYVMGNDDFVELPPASQRVRSLNLTRIDVGSYNFVGYQYTLPFMGGVFERPEEAVARDLESLASAMDDRTVLVTHGPARGILDSTLLGPAGSASLRDTIERRGVRAHIHGHIHSCFGRSGLHFNVASALKRRAMLIDLESMLHEVVGDAGEDRRVETPRA